MAIEPGSISSAESFGSPSVGQNIAPSGIPSEESFGSPGVPANLRPISIGTEEAFGGPTVLQIVPGQDLVIFVNGAQFNQNILVHHTLTIAKTQRSKSSATFSVIDRDGTMTPPHTWEEVIITNGTGYRMFGGLIETVTENHISGTDATIYDIRCLGGSAYTDRRIARRYYTTFLGGIASILMTNLIDDHMDGTGVSYVYTGDPGVFLGDVMFNHITVTEAINRIMDMVDWDWTMDAYKRIYMYPPDTGHDTAPLAIIDDARRFRKPAVIRNKSHYANKVYVKTDRDPGSMNVTTYTGNGWQSVFPVDYPLEEKPIIYVDGVEQVVYFPPLDTSVPPGMDFYSALGWTSVHTASDIPLANGAQLEIYYPGKLSRVYWAADDTEIASYGLVEYVEEIKDVVSNEAAQEIADQLLARMAEHPVDFEFETFSSDEFEPGQLLSVNITKPPLVADLVIDSINSRDVDKAFFWHKIKATNATARRTNTWNRFVAKMIERDRIAKDRIEYSIVFSLAVTVEGLTNPGLTTGLKTAVRNAPKDGNAINVTLKWFSIDEESEITVDRIVIDIYKNGTSIFPDGNDNKVIYPAGGVGTIRLSRFVEDPLEIAESDAFTCEVLEADSVARDGVLELRVRG